VHPSRPFLGST